MATLPTFVKRTEVRYPARHRDDHGGAVRTDDPYTLRPLPGEDVWIFVKLMDNSRVVRQANPSARGAWSAAGVMCLLAMLLLFSLAPRIANLLAGYRLEALREEQARLVDERQILDVEEAKARRLDRLQELARHKNLAPPKSGQLYDLEPKGDGSLASLAEKNH